MPPLVEDIEGSGCEDTSNARSFKERQTSFSRDAGRRADTANTSLILAYQGKDLHCRMWFGSSKLKSGSRPEQYSNACMSSKGALRVTNRGMEHFYQAKRRSMHPLYRFELNCFEG